MSDRAAKDALYAALASVAKALANGRRAELVDVLAQGERPVEELSAEIGQTVANTSQHLQQLLHAGLVRTRREGTRVYYSLASPQVAALWATQRAIAADHVADVERLAADYLGDRSRLQQMTQAELSRRLRDGDLVVLDVRPAAEYRAGHIAGARSLPIDNLRRRLREVPADAEVVAYCRGPYCVYADDAVRALQRRGRRAVRLEDGYPEWLRSGFPVEQGDETGSAPTR
ncbi:MAG TPA: metalloregulator ArsR/SmtB family transcription factor [Mycobacteriales bacterium]|nr:metalloregulator ArsR/SmtB family transcription factor [Mycobacteriales bacterium]